MFDALNMQEMVILIKRIEKKQAIFVLHFLEQTIETVQTYNNYLQIIVQGSMENFIYLC